MSFDKVDVRWQGLDPVFIRGMQRSGTSVITYALQEMGIVGFGEGHLWFDLLKPFMQLDDPSYFPDYRDATYTLGERRVLALKKYVAVTLDQFHRDFLSVGVGRWMDKSPGADAVYVVPLLAELFPHAQFIFMYRSGIKVICSAMKLWADHESWTNEEDLFQTMCQAWSETMSSWRNVRGALRGRYIEIAQEELASQPLAVASRLTDFLAVPGACSRVANLFQSKRVLSAFPDKLVGDYDYQIDWTNAQKTFFSKTCAEEMKIWGYPISFGIMAEQLSRRQKAYRLLRSGNVGGLWRETQSYLHWRWDNLK